MLHGIGGIVIPYNKEKFLSPQSCRWTWVTSGLPNGTYLHFLFYFFAYIADMSASLSDKSIC